MHLVCKLYAHYDDTKVNDTLIQRFYDIQRVNNHKRAS